MAFSVSRYDAGWVNAHATFYGGSDASGTMDMCQQKSRKNLSIVSLCLITQVVDVTLHFTILISLSLFSNALLITKLVLSLFLTEGLSTIRSPMDSTTTGKEHGKVIFDQATTADSDSSPGLKRFSSRKDLKQIRSEKRKASKTPFWN